MHAWLFVPGNQPHRMAKALASGADVVIMDWEDAVAPDAKVQARAITLDFLRSRPVPPASAPVYIRVHAAGSAEWDADLATLAEASSPRKLAGVVLAKASRPEDVRDTAARLSEALSIVPIIETAAGVERVAEIAAAHPAVARLAWGALDLALDLGLLTLPQELVTHVRCRMVMASRAAGLAPPLDAVFPDVRDEARLAAEAGAARRMGLGGKLVIHPRQVPVIRSAFAPTEEERQWASRVCTAYEAALREGKGAVQVDGRMVDRPVYEMARRLLRED